MGTIDLPIMLSQKELEKYKRQIPLDIVGCEGQEKLKSAKVLIAGAGGLGSPISMYLAAAGIGTIRIADDDSVSLSNLNRQLLYNAEDVGRKKAETAEKRLKKLNDDIIVEGINERISSDNYKSIVKECDLILDATDNFSTRYLLNRAALEEQIPFIYGGIYGLEGALTTIIPGETACLRCIFPEVLPLKDPPPVFGVAAGIIGCLQAAEAIKYILETGNLLTNRLLTFNGMDMKFREIKVRPNQSCPDCVSCS